MRGVSAPLRVSIAALLLVALLFAGQALSAPASVAAGEAGTTAALGRAGFAYLGGLRTFAAAVLWNRIEPIFHGYYAGVPLREQQYMVPTLYLVTVLDPQFVQAYYLSSYMVGRAVGWDEGVALAQEGVDNNPRSGLLRANLAQLQFIEDKQSNRDAILANIEVGLGRDAAWADDEERFEGYAVMATILKDLGDAEGAAMVDAVLERMRAAGLGSGDHDHDGDGKQDH